MRLLLVELVMMAGFVGTAGYLYREQFEKNFLLSFVVCILLVVSTISSIEWLAKRIGLMQEEVASIPGPAADDIFWLTIKDSASLGLFEEFVKRFPASQHVAEAQMRIEKLRKVSGAAIVNPPSKICVTFNGRQICN